MLMYYILSCYSRTWGILYQSRQKEANSRKSAFSSCDTYYALEQERIFHFPVVIGRVKRELIHTHSLLFFFAILIGYLESRLQWFLPSQELSVSNCFHVIMGLGLPYLERCSSYLLPSSPSLGQNYKDTKDFCGENFKSNVPAQFWWKGQE